MRLAIMSALVIILFQSVSPEIASAQATPKPSPTPLILEHNDGEHRVRKLRDAPLPTSGFIIKVDRRNGGSQKMWLGAEDIPPGGRISKHRHIGQDEILIIETGTAHVWLGDQERDAHAGGVVFIPSNTWVSLLNVGTESIRLAFIFSDPGYDEFMRCASVPEGETAGRMSPEEFKACQHQGHVEYDAAPAASTAK